MRKIQSEPFMTLPAGREAKLFTLTNDRKVSVRITNYGGIITSIIMPDKAGNRGNIVCGFNQPGHYFSEAYVENYPYFGALIGRFGNRIARGHLEIDGKTYQLAVNNGPNHLHGGETGFDRRLWEARPFEKKGVAGVELSYLSPHHEENYPGNLKVRCIYSLNDQNELSIEYFAETDQKTVVNLTNHTYFNLTEGRDTVLDHELKLNAQEMTEMVEQIPTGKIIPVEGTPFDFTEYKSFARDLEQLPTGFDDNFVLDNPTEKLEYAGSLREKSFGRRVDVYTTQPGMQLYTGYWIPEFRLEGEKVFGSYSGVALETQHFPDSVHHGNFPSTFLSPGEVFNEKTVYKFETE